ncbi:MAG: hypothetical protein ACREMQ_21845 [Longimicrobiales bacterium]
MTIFSSKVLTGGILAVIGLITVRILMALFGALMGFLSFLLSLLPIVLLIWVALKVFKYLTREREKKPAYE